MEDDLMQHPFMKYGGGPDVYNIHDYSFEVPRPRFLKVSSETGRYALIRNESGKKHKIYYEIHGNPNAEKKVLLVAGLAASHAEHEDQLKMIEGREREYAVCVFDNRGVGFSDTPRGRWTTSTLAKDVIGLMDHLKWEKCHILGVSMGGMITLETVLAATSRFNSITLISTHAGGVRGTLPPPQGFRAFLKTFGSQNEIDIIEGALAIKYPDNYLEIGPEEQLSREELEEERFWDESTWSRLSNKHRLGLIILRRMRKIGEHAGYLKFNIPGLLKQVFAVITHYVSYHRLEHIAKQNIPTLVICGTHDCLIHPSNSRRLAKALNATLLEEEDAGHCCNEQNHESVNIQIRQHIDNAHAQTGRVSRTNIDKDGSYEPHLHPYATLSVLFVLTYLLKKRFQLKFRKSPALLASATLGTLLFLKKYL